MIFQIKSHKTSQTITSVDSNNNAIWLYNRNVSLNSSNNQEDREQSPMLYILTVICLGENEVRNSQSNCEGEPADYERMVDY